MVERRGASLNEEDSWRPLYGAARLVGSLMKKLHGNQWMVERKGGSFIDDLAWKHIAL